MGEFSIAIISTLRSSFVKRAVQGQGGLLTGQNPTAYNSSDPLRLWVIQLGVILIMAQLLGLILGKIKQPRIIAEILGGILLGPTAFGRIPGFTNHIFPANSVPFLSLTANIGLCLFLFIIGLEIDPSVIRRNVRLPLMVSLAGVLLPFAIGCGMSVAIYHNFIGSSTNFNSFILFIGVSYSITAFPVLWSILSALKLLDTTVGLIALSAGVANNVIGWSLLALAVAFVNTTSGLTALWTFLTCVAYTLFLLFPTKWALRWLARRTGSTVHGPTMFYMLVVMLVLWGSAFFADIVGVNAIFGAFVVGVIVPREGGVSIAFMEKLEDMVQIIFLPTYFTISGLNTNLGLINTGTAWGFVFAIAILDFTGKFTSCTLSSRAFGLSWREATTVGSLMSCKGLVELIVLNVGLSAGILTRQVFSMFVLEALILTFMTTPLVNLIYPPKHRTSGLGARIAHTAPTDDHEEGSVSESSEVVEDEVWRHRFAVVLDEFNHMPGIMALTKLVLPPTSEDPTSRVRQSKNASVNALRLIELSERTSSMMKSTMLEELIRTDPLVGVFKMFGEQSDMPVSASLSVVAHNERAHVVAKHAWRHGSQLVLISWIPPSLGSMADPSEPGSSQSRGTKPEPNPFDTFLGLSSKDNSASMLYSHFVHGVFRHSKTDVALFVDLGDNAGTDGQQHVLFPFFGGPDDRLAIEFVVQLCANPRMSATVIRVGKRSEQPEIARPESAVFDEKTKLELLSPIMSSLAFPNIVYGKPNTAYLLQSETADDLTWSRYASPTFERDTHAQLRSALSRIVFTDLSNALPLHALVQRAKQLRETHRRLLVVAGRSKRFVSEGVRQELKQLVEERKYTGHETVRNTIGNVGAAFVMAAAQGAQSGVIVVQAVGDAGGVRCGSYSTFGA